jgi:hypothetical protein
MFVQVVLSGDDCHCAVEPEANAPIVKVTKSPLQMVVCVAVGAGVADIFLVSVTKIS